MKKKLLACVAGLAGAASPGFASTNFSYTATATPGSMPDGVDQNSNPVNIWTLFQVAGAGAGSSGAYEGTAFGGETLSGWQMYTTPGGPTPPNTAGSIDSFMTFPGGALTVGQSVSINFEMRAVNEYATVGVSVLNSISATAGTPAITFGIYGAEPDATNAPYTGSGYYHADASTGGVDTATPGTLGYQYQDEFNISFTVTGAGTYSAIATNAAGTDAWTGTYSGSLLGFDVFNHMAGDASDVAFNNLTVTSVPEPAALSLVSLGVVVLGSRFPRRARR